MSAVDIAVVLASAVLAAVLDKAGAAEHRQTEHGTHFFCSAH